MEVLFAFKNGQNTGYHNVGSKTILSKNGVFRTADKEVIETLISSELYKRNEVYMMSNPDLVNDYLIGDEPDYLTSELLRKLPDEAILELATVVGTKNKSQVMIVRSELRNEPITDVVREVLNGYELLEGQIDLLEQALEHNIVQFKRIWYTFPDEWEEKAVREKAQAAQVVYNHKEEVLDALQKLQKQTEN